MPIRTNSIVYFPLSYSTSLNITAIARMACAPSPRYAEPCMDNSGGYYCPTATGWKPVVLSGCRNNNRHQVMQSSRQGCRRYDNRPFGRGGGSRRPRPTPAHTLHLLIMSCWQSRSLFFSIILTYTFMSPFAAGGGEQVGDSPDRYPGWRVCLHIGERRSHIRRGSR